MPVERKGVKKQDPGYPSIAEYVNSRRTFLGLLGLTTLGAGGAFLLSCSEPAGRSGKRRSETVSPPCNGEADAVELNFALPKAIMPGSTPHNVPSSVRLDPKSKVPRPPYRAPKDVVRLSLSKPVSASDEDPIIGELQQITDGDKEGWSESYVELGPGLQWAQVDLGVQSEIFAILLWLHHGQTRVCHDVIVLVAELPISKKSILTNNARTVFNNDHDNSSGLGVGSDFEFCEMYEGKLIDCQQNGKGMRGRYVRVYTQGNTTDELNRFTEIEVWGRAIEGAGSTQNL